MTPTLGNGADITLREQALWQLPAGSSVEIANLRGTLWISRPEEPRDIVVAEGETIALDVQGLTLVAAIGGSADVRVEAHRRWPLAA
jgi:hypothetical protein